MTEHKTTASGGYLLVHFTGEHKDGEQVYFALSRDGLHWRDLSETPVLKSTVGMKGVRDPFMVRDPESGKVYIIATDLRIEAGLGWGAAQFEGSRDIVIWESEDLVNWSRERAVTVGIPEAGCVWAPESVYDPDKKCFFVYFASMVSENGEAPKQRMYGVYTKDFVTFSEPFQWIERESHVIDVTILPHNGKYHRVYVDDTVHRLTMDSSSDPVDGYEHVHSETLADLPGVEGPVAYHLKDGKCCLLADHIRTGEGYVPFVTDDPSKNDWQKLDAGTYDMGKLKKRHGGVIEISEDELARLSEKYGIDEL